MKQLLALGPSVGTVAMVRLPDAPWFVQRNILVLLGRLGEWPPGFSPTVYAVNPDARIRREAFKLMLESAAHRDEAISQALADADEGIVALALSAALDFCPPCAVPPLQRIAADPRRPAEARVLAIRSLARSGTDAALHLLRDLALPPRRWLRRRLAPRSPELLAALSGLATHWRNNAVASEALSRALQHSDPDIRAAAGGR